MDGKIFYVTKEKLNELKKEYDKLIVFERNKTIGVEAPKVLESEDMNPEFVSYHEDMEILRSRIDELKGIIENHKLIKNPPKERQTFVDMGAKVTLDVDGKRGEFMIVGTLEANPSLNKISNESPVGRAILGHKIGDEIIISSPEKIKYKIKNIKYEIG